MTARPKPRQGERHPDYIVVRAGQVVQEISALTADHAIAAKTEPGALYTRVWGDGHAADEVEAFLAEALPLSVHTNEMGAHRG